LLEAEQILGADADDAAVGAIDVGDLGWMWLCAVMGSFASLRMTRG